MAEGETSPFSEREQILQTIGSAIGIRLNESTLSKETLEKIDKLVKLKERRKMKQAESWRYFSRVHRYWWLFYPILILGILLIPFFLIGLVIIAADLLLYRWIRKREHITPQASLDAIELSKSYTADLLVVHNAVRAEIPANGPANTTRNVTEISDFVGRAAWIEIDSDHSWVVFKARKGIVVKLFTQPPCTREAVIIELSPPPFAFCFAPRKIRFLVAEYYQKWDSIRYTLNRGHSFVKYLRLKNKAVLGLESYNEKDVRGIGCGFLSLWPVPSNEELWLKKQEAVSSD